MVNIVEINIFQVDAFTSTPFHGNPAAVIPNTKGLDDTSMRQIANELKVSETAFVNQVYEDLYNIRYFTPKCEVELCGHGTIATFYTLAAKGYIKPIFHGIKKVHQITKMGKLPVELRFKNNTIQSVIMEVAPPEEFGQIENIEPILEALNISKSDIGVAGEYISPEIISTGLKDTIIPLNNKETLDNLNVDLFKIRNLTKELGTVGIHVFYLSEEDLSKVYVRNFAPLVGIDEEAATGTANGSLLYYLKKNKLIKDNKITALQGHSINRPSEIKCYINEEENGYSIKVEGEAKIVIDGIISF